MASKKQKRPSKQINPWTGFAIAQLGRAQITHRLMVAALEEAFEIDSEIGIDYAVPMVERNFGYEEMDFFFPGDEEATRIICTMFPHPECNVALAVRSDHSREPMYIGFEGDQIFAATDSWDEVLEGVAFEMAGGTDHLPAAKISDAANVIRFPSSHDKPKTKW